MPAVPATAHVKAIAAFTATARRAPPRVDRCCASPVLPVAALFGRWRVPLVFERFGLAPAAFWRPELPEEARRSVVPDEARRAVVPDGFRDGRAVVVRLAGFAPRARCAV
jgi:hypothetical protein